MAKYEDSDLILRDKLALDRTVLANQRTLLSYIKTSIFLVSTAIGLYYLRNKGVFTPIEFGLFVAAGVSLFLGFIVYFRVRYRIKSLYKVKPKKDKKSKA